VSFLYLFPNIEVDLLSKIPSHGMLATTTRLAMIITTMASTPLLIVPCAEIIEGKILNNEDGQTKSKKLMIIIRTCILLCTVLIASELPSFVSVLAFAGSFAVSMVSFVLPPGLHWLLLRQGYYDGPGGLDFPIWSRICDLSMLLIGFLTTIITTWFAGS
jgi:amino acid permease